jgi:2,4-dienoyl-CoA reductase-like NADH-dependent reductase (Old Yellow Enzyme family)
MCQYSSSDGFANDWHLVHLGTRAVGGAGLVMTEATAVSPEGRITPGDLGIYRQEHTRFLSRIAAFITAQGSVPGIQLAHAGRKASCAVPWEGGRQLSLLEGGWETLAPSPVPFHRGDRPPAALSESGVREVCAEFARAAQRALEAGFRVIEIHAAHGYLLHEFYSPLSNQRDDGYGGSLENRCRIVVEVARSVRSVWPPHYPLFVRISATDWTESGWNAADSVALARMLGEAGVDLIDCSSGGNVHAHIPASAGYQVPFAKKVKEEGRMATGAVGLITEAAQADRIIRDGDADIVFLARQMLREPYFALHAARQLHKDIAWPVQYERAKQ